MEFGYWGIKGRGEICRWIIGLTGLKITEKNPASKEEWGQLKAQFGSHFANLPYLIDGDFKLTESHAIHYYLAEKAGREDLVGKDAQERARVIQIEGVVTDIFLGFMKTLGPNTKTELEKSLEAGSSLQTKVAELSKFLGDKEYFLGHLTLADLGVVYVSQFGSSFVKANGLTSPFCQHANLKALEKRVTSLPGLKEVSDARKPVPFMPPGMLPFEMLTVTQMESEQH